MGEQQPDRVDPAPAADAVGGGGPTGSGRGRERRLQFASADLERLPGSKLRISVALSDGGRRHEGQAEGVGGRQVELRLAVQAALDAVGAALDRPGFIRLVGLKQVHAFDADLVLVAVRTEDEPGRRLVGAVPVDEDPCRAAALATLDAVNRVAGPELPAG